jgi:hypothetical protein
VLSPFLFSIALKMYYFRTAVTLTTAVIFFSLSAAYTINADCASNYNIVNGWIKEAIYLFDRSAQVIDFYLNGGNSRGVNHILQTLLGRATGPSDYAAVRGRIFQKMSIDEKPTRRLLISYLLP